MMCNKLQGFIFILLSFLLSLFLVNNYSVIAQTESFPETIESQTTDTDDLFSEIKLSEPIMLEARIDVPLKLSLKEALDFALNKNLDIVDAKYQKNIHKWKYWENIGNWLPDYSLGLNARRFDGTFLVGGVFPVSTLTSNVNAFMRFDYRFFEGGKGLFNTLAAKNLYKSAKEYLDASINETLLAVTKAYNRLLKEQAYLNVLAKAVEEADSELELNINLEKAGVGTRFDVLQSEEFLEDRKQKLIAQQALARSAAVSLAALLTLDQETHIIPDVSDLAVMVLYSVEEPIDELIAKALDNRPEIKKQDYEYKAKRNYIGVAASAFLPRANFFGQYGGTGRVIFNRTKEQVVAPDAIRLDDEGNPIVQTVRTRINGSTLASQVSPSIENVSNVIRGGGKPFITTVNDSLMASKFIGIEVDWVIGDGLGIPTISKINQARSEAKQSKISLDKLYLNIEKEVRTSYLNVQATNKLLDVAEKRIKAAKEALHLAKVRVENGIGINTELISAQRQYTESLASKVDAVIEYNNAQAEMLYSLGLISIESLL